MKNKILKLLKPVVEFIFKEDSTYCVVDNRATCATEINERPPSEPLRTPNKEEVWRLNNGDPFPPKEGDIVYIIDYTLPDTPKSRLQKYCLKDPSSSGISKN